MHRNKPVKGVSLIELLFVLAILSLVVLSAWPALNSAFRDGVNNQANANAQTLNQAANRARLAGQVGPGTFGSDKPAAIQWYRDQRLVQTTDNFLEDQLVYINGLWFPLFETQGKVFYQGSFYEPPFDPNDPVAVANALLNFDGYRASAFTHGVAISTLNQSLGNPNINPNLIQDKLWQELQFVAGHEDTGIGSPEFITSDFSQIDLTGRGVFQMDLAGTGISATQLNASNTVEDSNLSGLNLTGLNPTILSTGNNYSNSTGLTGTDFSNFPLQYSNLSGLNLTGFTPTGGNLIAANFTNTTGLAPENLALATNLSGINLTGTGITETQLRDALIAESKNPDVPPFQTSTMIFE